MSLSRTIKKQKTKAGKPKDKDKPPPTQEEILTAFRAFFAKKSSLRRLYRTYQVNHKSFAIDFSKVDGSKDLYRYQKQKRQSRAKRDFKETPNETALKYIYNLEKKFDLGEDHL